MPARVVVYDDVSDDCDLRDLVPYTRVTSNDNSATVQQTFAANGQPVYDVSIPASGADTFGIPSQAAIAGSDFFGTNYVVGDSIITFPGNNVVVLPSGTGGIDTNTFGIPSVAAAGGTDFFGDAFAVGDRIVTFPGNLVVQVPDSGVDTFATAADAAAAGTDDFGNDILVDDTVITLANGDEAVIPSGRVRITESSNTTAFAALNNPNAGDFANAFAFNYTPVFSNSNVTFYASLNGALGGNVAAAQTQGLFMFNDITVSLNGGAQQVVASASINTNQTDITGAELHRWSTSYSTTLNAVAGANQSIQFFMVNVQPGQNTTNFITRDRASILVVETEV